MGGKNTHVLADSIQVWKSPETFRRSLYGEKKIDEEIKNVIWVAY